MQRLVVYFVLTWLIANRLPGADIDFERNVAAVLLGRCLECHNSTDKQGGLDLSTAAGLATGGESGPVLEPGLPESSLLWQRVNSGEMPPAARGKSQQLPQEEIQQLHHWIASGAVWPNGRTLDPFERTTAARGGRDWWSLQPIRLPAIPQVANRSWATDNPIDAFVQQQLHARQMEPAPAASASTLVRRLYIDLWGIPPTAEEIDAFVADDRPVAYEQLVDRLLAAPHYGERWARHWLDVVRFAETCGYERDQLKPNIWKYRDWVIRSLNNDLPYDRFVTEQLAGDEVPDRSESSVIATGMLRAGTWNDEPNDPADYLYERLEDMVHVTSSAFLGLTVKCARCHDHKFDPIEQEDYYRMASFFWAGYIGQANLGGPSQEELGFEVCGWTDKANVAEPLHLLIKGERNRPGPVVAPAFLSALSRQPTVLQPAPPTSRTTQRRLQFAAWLTAPDNPLTARVMVNRLWQHHFGNGIVRSVNNFGFKGELPSHPELLDWLAAEFRDGGWRLKRIHKLIVMSATYRQSCDHPHYQAYANRDFANHFLWHMAQRRLDAETLRDALLHASAELNLAMGGPSFFPHMSSEALEGLSRKDAAWTESPGRERARRSIYMMTMRSRILPLMTAFDFCDTTMPCGQRDVTTVAPQALALLNNEFVHERSMSLAKRLVAEQPTDETQQIRLAFRAVLSRYPSTEEQAACEEHRRDQFATYERLKLGIVGASSADDVSSAIYALASICHVLMNSNEFIFVE